MSVLRVLVCANKAVTTLREATTAHVGPSGTYRMVNTIVQVSHLLACDGIGFAPEFESKLVVLLQHNV